MYVLHLNAKTQKMAGLLNYFAADPNRLTRAWPATSPTMQDVLDAGIDEVDWNWFTEDLQNANITRLGDNQFRLSMRQISEKTPSVIETLLNTTNREGTPHLDLAVYETESAALYHVSGDYPPVSWTYTQPPPAPVDAAELRP